MTTPWPTWYIPPGAAPLCDILPFVAKEFGLTSSDIRSQRRDTQVVTARWIIAKALRKRGGLSFPVIGRMLNSDHTTIINACDQFDRRAMKYPEMQRILAKVL